MDEKQFKENSVRLSKTWIFWKDTITLLLPFAETHSPLDDPSAEVIPPKTKAEMLCSIRLKLERTEVCNRSSNVSSALPNPPDSSLPKDSMNGFHTGDITKNAKPPECQSKSPLADIQANIQLGDSSFSSLATPPVEEEEEGSIFQMFRSKNNNTLLDVLCDSLIKEGVTKKFASKNFDISGESSTRDPVQRKPAGTGSIPCPQCDSTFSKFRYLKDHIKRKHEVHKCPICGDSTFNSQVGVAKHLRRFHQLEGDQVEAAVINANENTSEPVSDSKENDVDVEIPQVDDVHCDQEDTGDDSTLDSMMDGYESNTVSSTMVPSEINEDDDCAENPTQDGNRRKVKGTGNIPCPHCNSKFSAERNLKDHIKRKHVAFTCPVCGDDSFASHKGVERHMGRVHAGESLLVGNVNALILAQSSSQFTQNSIPNFPADSASEHLDASFQGFSTWNVLPERKSRRKSEPFPISQVSKVLQTPNVTSDVVNESLENSITEPKKKKQRGMGTIPCPQCDSIFSEQRYLRDHRRRKHEKIECPVCGDTNFYSYRGVQKHIEKLHSQSKANEIGQDDKSSTCSSEPIAQPLRNSTNGNLQAEASESDNNAFQNDTPDLEPVAEKPNESKDENALKGKNKKKKQPKVTTPVVQSNKRKSETLKPDVRSDAEESVHESDNEKGEWVTVEPKKKRRRIKKARGAGTIPCPRCDTTFSKARYLKDHIKRKHDVSRCPICSDNFYSQRGVDRHVREVHGE